jgi:copper-binding protein NosD/Big-like domain-containing protein
LLLATVARVRRTLFVALPGLLALACSCSSSPPPPPSSGPPPKPPTVAFLGPTRLTGPTTLTARARAYSSRVVAVTFTLDGRPLGSDTTRPYELDIEPELLVSGPHRIRVVAVDSLGRRAATAPRDVMVAPSGSRVVDVAPGTTFAGAIDALRRGDVTVRLAPGRYEVRELEVGSGTRLVGSGEETVIAPAGDAGYWALLVARGNRIRISDLTIDGGGGPATSSSREGGIAVAVFDGSHDVRLQRLHIRAVRTDGVNAWGAHWSVSVQDSVIDGGGTGRAGVFTLGSDDSRDTSVIRTRISGFRSFGILLGQQEFGRPRAALHGVALDNVISDIRDPARDACVTDARTAAGCGTNEGGIWTGGVEAAIIGNSIRRTRWDGIETVGSSTRTTIVANEIRETRTGIYLEHATNDSVISRNLIVGAETGINVEWLHDGVGSSGNTFTLNRVVGADSGLFVDVGSDGNRIVRNLFVGGARPAITLQGSSENIVRDNLVCGGPLGPLVGFESARWDSGAFARSTRNRLSGNRSVKRC